MSELPAGAERCRVARDRHFDPRVSAAWIMDATRMEATRMIHKNWQELIKPTQLVVKPGNDPAARQPSSPNRSSVASA
jgi:hypothetical protein